jgi:hypothetical protein
MSLRNLREAEKGGPQFQTSLGKIKEALYQKQNLNKTAGAWLKW